MAQPFCQGANWKPRRSSKEAGTCGACGKPLVGRNLWFCPSAPGTYNKVGKSCRATYAAHHFWGEARQEALRRARGRCSKCGEEVQSERLREGLEVHHIVPRDGGGYGPGCHHHQDNLEALCHQGHLEVTAEQRGYGRQPTIPPGPGYNPGTLNVPIAVGVVGYCYWWPEEDIDE